MKNKKRAPASPDLRRRAEEQLGRREDKAAAPVSEGDARRLLHELEVHQIELEMQNEELRAARLATEAGLARYTELFDFAPIGYATLAPDGTIREINHAGAGILGKERARLAGKRFVDFLAVGQGAAFAALLGGAQASEVRESCEVELAGPRTAPRHLRLSATALVRDEATTLLAFEDITDRKVKEEKLARTEQALREADRRKDEFLAVLSHELRNPLAPIRNSLFVLQRAEPGSERAHKAQAVIERQVVHLTRLVDDLLDVTRIARGKIQLQRERLELGDLVRRTMEDHRVSFEGSGIRLEGRFDPGLFWVEADAARLVQAVSNLLGNAEKFTPRGQSVVVSLQREGTRAVLRVSDTGVGIAPEVIEHLFEPFAQAPQSLDRNRGGLGLGLAMVKGLIELHGGTASIASDGLGHGTAITVSLPLEPAPAQVAAGAEASPTRRRRVLIIEDNRDSADSLRDALALSGHELEVAYDGHSGIEVARRLRPEIALCDIGLPGMDGYEVARAFRADEELRSTYLVALTGYALSEDHDRAKEAGFDAHVAKPPALEKLERLLADAPAAPRSTEPSGALPSSCRT